jgi:hypothetical protein
MHHVPDGTMVRTLKCEKLVDRLYGLWIGGANAHLRTAWPVARGVAQGGCMRGHDGGARYVTSVDEAWIREVSARELARDFPHVRPDRRDIGRITRLVPIEYDAAAVRQVFEDVR